MKFVITFVIMMLFLLANASETLFFTVSAKDKIHPRQPKLIHGDLLLRLRQKMYYEILPRPLRHHLA